MAKSQLAQNPVPIIKVLLVEDNPSDADIVSNFLGSYSSANYEIHHVLNQEQAISSLCESNYDVCLLDLTLPDAYGFSALIDIQERSPDMPVLILTGTKDTALAKRAVARGAQDYLLKDDMETEFLARSIDYAIERKNLEINLFMQANYDSLTGIANRTRFMDRMKTAMARAERTGIDIAVLFIDLDRFKPINDTYGHEAGDETLKIVAERIKTSLRSYDTAARLGGDEFAVLLEDIGSPRNAASIAQKIISSIAVPVNYKDRQFDIGASIGIVFIDRQMTAESLLQNADLAMYSAKKDGSNLYRFYVDNMQNAVSERLSLEEDLRTAFAVDELEIYYQPYFSTSANELLGVEALIRWKHPERGILSADEFLYAAETCRLMPEVTKFMSSQLYHDIAMFNAKIKPITISINFSSSQLDSPDLIQILSPVLNKDFLGDNKVVIEVNAEAISPISGMCFMVLAKLHDMGIGLNIDHFGLNMVPLTTLCELPFSILKIDMSLIKNMNKEKGDNMLINAAIILAHQLGMKIGAVGVEEQWQAELLASQGCDVIQGFYNTEPMSAKKLVEWLENK